MLHQAALGSVPRSLADPAATNATNIDGFLNMLIAARDAGVRRFVYAASSSTYGDHPALPKVEDAIGRPLSPVCRHQARQRALRRRVRALLTACRRSGLRYFNIFGARQDPEGAYAAVIPRWIRAMLAGERGRDQRRRRDEPRLLLRRQRRAGEPARGRRRRRGGDQPDLQCRRRRPHDAQPLVRRCCATPSHSRSRAWPAVSPMHLRLPPRRCPAFAGRHRQGAPAAGLRARRIAWRTAYARRCRGISPTTASFRARRPLRGRHMNRARHAEGAMGAGAAVMPRLGSSRSCVLALSRVAARVGADSR